MAKNQRYNHFQPIYFEYIEALTKDIAGWVMPFPNLKRFKSSYGEEQENAPTNSLLDILRLLLPQIRVINKLVVDGQPNPAAFLAYEPIDPKILSLIFSKWVEVWYPELEHQYLKSLCTPNQFEWKSATPEQLEWWSPAWSVAKHLSKYQDGEYRYKLGNNEFNLLFAPGRKGNTVELVSWPPFSTPSGYKSSLGIIISSQSDFSDRRINIHFKMKRWVVKRGENVDINLQTKTTHCYIRRLTSWSGNFNLLEPNAFTVLEAKNFRRESHGRSESNNSTGADEKKFERRWKDKKILEILEKLSVDIPDLEDVLQNPLNYIETEKTDILIPARSWQKAGWGTGFTISDSRRLLKQIIAFLPAGATLTKPWQKISAIKDNDVIKEKSKDADKSIKRQFIKNPKLQKPSQNQLPELTEEFKEFLQQRANNITLHVCSLADSKTKDAIEKVANHYFGDSLKLKFYSSQSLADPIQYEKSKKKDSKNKKIPQLKHIKKFGEQYQPENPEPIIVEILSSHHPLYNGDADPKSYIKSELPKYNLIPQCIVSAENIDKETKEATLDKKAKKSLLNRALSSILDAIMPFDRHYPLTTSEDNNVYAGFYVISRNKATSSQSFNEPVLVVIYKNEIKVLLPAQDTKLRSFPQSICHLANNTKNTTRQDERTVNTMLEQLSINYSDADNIYLYAHEQNARTYWQWLQDGKFDKDNPPTKKITIMRVRDSESNEVAQGYGLETKDEDFTAKFNPESASFAQGIFIAPNCEINNIPLTRTILSVAPKPQTLSKQIKTTSRVESYTDFKGETKSPSPNTDWKMPQPRSHNILATPSPDKFILHHAIAHHLRSVHWWSADECEYPLPLSLAKKIKEWCFST
ncbi:MAG: DUF3893 domain-containing protein [Pleurocapsa minor HA4230-MV1]|jgi:hypothetical protein|nr:DUF3893 domain-containing protein [Pleurocapsa minor HA4230-MV1]